MQYCWPYSQLTGAKPVLFEVGGHFAIDSTGTEFGIWKHTACVEIWTYKVFDLWFYLPMLLFSLQLFLVKCSFRHLIFQVNTLLHKLLIFSHFLQLGYVIWISSMHLIIVFALYLSLFFGLWGLKNTGVQDVPQHLAFVVLPRFQLLLQCTVFSNEVFSILGEC